MAIRSQVIARPDVYRDAHASHWKWEVAIREPGAEPPESGMFHDELVYMYDVYAFDAGQALQHAERRHSFNLDNFGTKWADVIKMVENIERLSATLAQIAHMCNSGPVNADRRDKMRDNAMLALKETRDDVHP